MISLAQILKSRDSVTWCSEANETLQELQHQLRQEQERAQEIGRQLQTLQRQKNILKVRNLWGLDRRDLDMNKRRSLLWVTNFYFIFQRETQAAENNARNGHNRVEQLQDQLQQEEPANIQALEESKQVLKYLNRD